MRNSVAGIVSKIVKLNQYQTPSPPSTYDEVYRPETSVICLLCGTGVIISCVIPSTAGRQGNVVKHQLLSC